VEQVVKDPNDEMKKRLYTRVCTNTECRVIRYDLEAEVQHTGLVDTADTDLVGTADTGCYTVAAVEERIVHEEEGETVKSPVAAASATRVHTDTSLVPSSLPSVDPLQAVHSQRYPSRP
jgi:hypothetical protein